MKLIRNRFATVLILIIILAACVQAQPNGGNESFDDNMDWPWDLVGSVGEQFADALVSNQFNMEMTPVSRPRNSRSITSPPQHWRPQLQPQLHRAPAPTTNYNYEYFPFTNMELAEIMEAQERQRDLRSAPILTFAQEPFPNLNSYNNTTMAHWSYGEAGEQQQHHATTQTTASYQSSETVPAPANAANMYGYPHAPQARNSQWSSQLQAMSVIPSQGLEQYSGAQFDAHQPLPLPVVDDQAGRHASEPVNTVPHILPMEVTSNPNYESSTVPDAPGNMLGWIRRAPAIGERTLPSRLDTNLLAPPEANSADRSPTSASTTGSSAGSRRQRWEMTGDFVCHWCNAGFTTQGDLTHHLRSHQPYLSRQHVCQHCQKRFQYRKDLTRHLPKHDPNRKKYYCIFKGCKYYGRGFGRQDHLDRHIQTQHRIDTPQQSSRPSSSSRN